MNCNNGCADVYIRVQTLVSEFQYLPSLHVKHVPGVPHSVQSAGQSVAKKNDILCLSEPIQHPILDYNETL